MAPIQALMLLFLLLPQAFICMVHADACEQQTTCATCTSKSSGFFGCRWCITSGKCFAFSIVGSDCGSTVDVVSSPNNCPVDPNKGSEYSDGEGRKGLYLSAAAYSPYPAACLQQHMNDMVLYSQYEIPCDSQADTCRAFTAVSLSQRRVVVSFRGTLGFEQLAFEIINGAEGTLGEMTDFPAGGKVLYYFSNAFFAIWNAGLERDLTSLKKKYGDFQLWAVGHSLGGALASMMSALVTTKALWNNAAVHLMTFGQPRVGNAAYAQVVEQYIGYRYRVVHEYDVVPHIPPPIPGGISDGPFHHRFEVWYNNDMSHASSFTVCKQAEDLHCSGAHYDVSVTDHLYYYGVEVADYGRANCSGPFDFGTRTV